MSFKVFLYFIAKDIDRGITIFVDDDALTISNRIIDVLTGHDLQKFLWTGKNGKNVFKHNGHFFSLKDKYVTGTALPPCYYH